MHADIQKTDLLFQHTKLALPEMTTENHKTLGHGHGLTEINHITADMSLMHQLN
jgi:hypothetical protein